MLLRNPLTSYVYHYGLHAGIPYNYLKGIANIWDILKRPIDFFARQRHARTLLHNSNWRGFLPREKGYRRFEPGEIPELHRLVEIGQKLYADRGLKHERGRESKLKSPITHLLRDEDLLSGSEIVEIATSQSLIEIATDYLGSIPRLDHIDLWVSRPNEADIGSQLFHLDKPDRHFLRIFVHVNDVAAHNGPLTFIAADVSQQVRKATGYEKLYYHGDGRLSDETLFAVVPHDSAIKLIGPPGSGAFVDASECLHFGSRCEQGQRVMFVVTYVQGHKKGTGQIASVSDPHGEDKLVSLVLAH